MENILKNMYFSTEAEALNVAFLDNGCRVMATYKFPNGNVASFGYDNQQIPMLQGVYSKELEERIRQYSDEKTRWNGF